MSYQVIARKWRPQNFSQLVGQDHISVTLTNALAHDRVPQALLFTGPRGTGKTSSARIFAKALRCPRAVNFTPCNECPDCQEIALGRSADVLEIDGASNNGVDSIRELRENVMYSPSSGKYKIYIIDEVHMLSSSAFNALLKTLEEPPAHVVFIMATTDVHKVPQTILSRCQKFDFRRIPTRVILQRLSEICAQEKVQTDEEALWLIALQGDGSMRDSQSLLDQVISFANGPLTLIQVSQILGLTDRNLLQEALEALLNRSPKSLLPVIEKINRAGYEPDNFMQDLLQCLRHVLVLKIEAQDANASDLVELADSEIRFLKNLGRGQSQEDLHLLFDLALKSAQDLSRSQQPRLVLEMALLRLACAPRVADLQSLVGKATKMPSSSGGGQILQSVAKDVSVTSAKPAAVTASVRKPRTAAERWYDFVQEVKGKDSLLGAKIETLLFVSEQNRTLDLAVPSREAFIKTQMEDKDTRARLQSLVDQFWGAPYKINLQVEKQNANTAASVSAKDLDLQKAQDLQKSLQDQVASHSKIKAAHAIFKTQIKEIKEIP